MPEQCEIHALLLGLSEDLAGELLRPLHRYCGRIEKTEPPVTAQAAAASDAQIIFCDADVNVVTELRNLRPEASIVVVSRHAEVSDWLDSIEAGATDYCAAPFENDQVGWIVEASLRRQQSQ